MFWFLFLQLVLYLFLSPQKANNKCKNTMLIGKERFKNNISDLWDIISVLIGFYIIKCDVEFENEAY